MGILSLVLFVLAILHTFLVGKIEVVARKYPDGSIARNFWHYLAEVEVVFGLWSLILILIMLVYEGPSSTLTFLNGLNFTEPAFVFVIMCMAATKPIILFAEKIIYGISKILPFKEKLSFYLATMIIGPLLGSFITEPAAMTVTALILYENFYKRSMSLKFKYATLGLLLVNVSIGGTLTHFAAPPVLMVAAKWGWDTSFMMANFGLKAIAAVIISTAFYAYAFRDELQGIVASKEKDAHEPAWWKIFIQIILLVLVVLTAHHPKIFIGIFCFFLGFVSITRRYQTELKLKESFLVGFFLAGLITLGSLQSWWLKPLLANMSDTLLYLGATALTAVTDNAALTYLGSLVELSDSAKYALVAGAVTGGGLTVIANAPNPVAFGFLKNEFGKEGISPLKLFLAASFPTLVSMLFFYFLF